MKERFSKETKTRFRRHYHSIPFFLLLPSHLPSSDSVAPWCKRPSRGRASRTSRRECWIRGSLERRCVWFESWFRWNRASASFPPWRRRDRLGWSSQSTRDSTCPDESRKWKGIDACLSEMQRIQEVSQRGERKSKHMQKDEIDYQDTNAQRWTTSLRHKCTKMNEIIKTQIHKDEWDHYDTYAQRWMRSSGHKCTKINEFI